MDVNKKIEKRNRYWMGISSKNGIGCSAWNELHAFSNTACDAFRFENSKCKYFFTFPYLVIKFLS